MITVICLDLDYYKCVGHVILGFKNINIYQWMDVMLKPNMAADELAIFALSKLYRKYTVIYNKARPWSMLDPPYLMTESELHDNCQIHLVYVGKDSYGILCLKPFEDMAAPLSGENMLEPMKLYKTPKSKCQKEPWDLSVCHSDISADMSSDLIDNEQSDMPASDLKSMDIEITNTGRSSTPVPKPGENVKIGSDDDVAVLVNKWKGVPDELCYTWSKVKLSVDKQ